MIGSLADVGVRFSLLALGLDSLAESTWTVRVLAIALIVVMTAICVLGTEMSAKLQNALIFAQVAALLVFAATALWRVIQDDSSLESLTPSFAWLNPFGAGGAALTGGLLLGVFAYWGWESAVNLTEETEDSESTPGKAALVSTVLLLVTYVSVAFAVVAYSGTEFLANNSGEEEFIFGLLATEVMGGWDWVVLVAVATAAIASTQTTILPASRTGLSMARRAALPARLAHIHPRYRTPDVSTWTVAAVASAQAAAPVEPTRALRPGAGPLRRAWELYSAPADFSRAASSSSRWVNSRCRCGTLRRQPVRPKPICSS